MTRGNAHDADARGLVQLSKPYGKASAKELQRVVHERTGVDYVEQFVQRYCVSPDELYLPIACWIIATYLARECFECFPYLAIISPAKRCGKSRVLDVLELLC